MGDDSLLLDPSYLTCEINGSQLVFQTLPSSPNTLVEVGTLIEDKESDTFSKYEKDDEEDTVPIVCLNGVIYAIQNGQLQELDLSKLQNSTTDEKDDNSYLHQQQTFKDPSDLYSEPKNSINCLKENSTTDAPVVTNDCDYSMENNSALNANDFVEVVAAFKCKICPFTSQDRAQLLKHFENTHANPRIDDGKSKKEVSDEECDDNDEVKLLYMCGECSNCFPSMENCREHMIKDHQLVMICRTSNNLPPSSSSEISAPSSETYKGKSNSKASKQAPKASKKSAEYLENKKNIETKERSVKCMYGGCLQKFSTEEMMQKHAACHVESQGVEAFKCSICPDMKFTKWKVCCSHLWKKHEIDIDMLVCNICHTYKSVSSVKLLTHMRVHSESRDFECRDCGKRFKQANQLRNHRVIHVDRKAVEGPRWYTSKTCGMCGKTYADSKCLKNHMQAVHSKLRPYVCNVCGHSSARKAMLQMHLRQHTGDKPFNCDICDFKTGDHNSLRRHVMRHTGVRPYKCPHCSYSAIQSSSYKNHLKAKHPTSSDLFTCELCPFKTVKNESYIEHVANHEKGLIKAAPQKTNDNNVEVFPGNMAAAQLIYSCLGAFSKEGNAIEASLMSSSTSADGTSQTITIQIPSTHLEGSLPMAETNLKNNNSTIDQEDEETMHCFLKIPHEEEESIDTGGITIPAEPENLDPGILNVES